MKILTKVLFGASLVMASTMVFAGTTLDRVTSKKLLVVATNAEWPPQSFINDKNQLDGFDIDVSNEIARRLGVAIKFETPDWTTLTGGRWQGRYDLGVGSVTPTKSRAQAIDFVAVYYYSPYVFVVHRDSKAQSPADLNNKVIGVETATTSEDYIRHQLEIDAPGIPPIEYKVSTDKIRTYPNSIPPFDDLRLGNGVRLDAIVAPEQTAKYAIDNKYPVRILPGGYAFKEPLVILAEKTDPEWNAKIGQLIHDMKSDGTLAKLTTKWYGQDYSAN